MHVVMHVSVGLDIMQECLPGQGVGDACIQFSKAMCKCSHCQEWLECNGLIKVQVVVHVAACAQLGIDGCLYLDM